MRVALVSPYSWTYPGGVTRHIESLRASLARAGHDVTVLAPFDPDRRRTAFLHRGARPQVRDVPEWLPAPRGAPRRGPPRARAPPPPPTPPSQPSPPRRPPSRRGAGSCAGATSPPPTSTSRSRR